VLVACRGSATRSRSRTTARKVLTGCTGRYCWATKRKHGACSATTCAIVHREPVKWKSL
jgi:hypothetical protein